VKWADDLSWRFAILLVCGGKLYTRMETISLNLICDVKSKVQSHWTGVLVMQISIDVFTRLLSFFLHGWTIHKFHALGSFKILCKDYVNVCVCVYVWGKEREREIKVRRINFIIEVEMFVKCQFGIKRWCGDKRNWDKIDVPGIFLAKGKFVPGKL